MRLTGAVRVGTSPVRLAGCVPGTVQREAFTSARSRILASVHVTSGCGQLSRRPSEPSKHCW